MFTIKRINIAVHSSQISDLCTIRPLSQKVLSHFSKILSTDVLTKNNSHLSSKAQQYSETQHTRIGSEWLSLNVKCSFCNSHTNKTLTAKHPHRVNNFTTTATRERMIWACTDTIRYEYSSIRNGRYRYEYFLC